MSTHAVTEASTDNALHGAGGLHPHGGEPRLVADSISVGYRETPVITDLSLTVPTGVITTVIGPNGCGKSTLLRALSRLLSPSAGAVTLDGRAIASMKSREVARTLGLLPQSPIAPAGLRVADLVARGRHPHQSWLRQWSSDDADRVAAALEQTGISDLADRPVDSLSGGQRQRVWISLALAQETDLLLLDEPTTFLDLAHSLEVLDLVDSLHDDLNRTVVMVLHDLSLAARYSDHLVVMKEGSIVATGTPSEVITEELLADVFDLKARVIEDPVSDRPLIIPVGNRHVHPHLTGGKA